MTTMRTLLILSMVASVLAFGCRDGSAAGSGDEPSPTAAAVSTLTAGLQYGTISVDGRDRNYRLYVPASLPKEGAASLVVAMHGGLGWPDQFAANGEFDAAAEKFGVLIVHPEGVSRTWNGGACCGVAVRQNVDDVAFISALIDHVSGLTPVDPGRVFAMGHSNGGIMSYRLACELSDKIAAIGSVAGSLEIETCAPAQPVAVMAIHGDADQNHPLEGGRGPNAISGVDFNSHAASLESLRTANGCGADTSSQTSGAITTTTWAGCREGGEVISQVIAGASHAWPGAARAGAASVGTPSQAMDATEAVLTFFQSHGRD